MATVLSSRRRLQRRQGVSDPGAGQEVRWKADPVAPSRSGGGGFGIWDRWRTGDFPGRCATYQWSHRLAAGHCFGLISDDAKMRYQIQVWSSALACWRSGGGGWKSMIEEAQDVQLIGSQGPGCNCCFSGGSFCCCAGTAVPSVFRSFLRVYARCTVCLL